MSRIYMFSIPLFACIYAGNTFSQQSFRNKFVQLLNSCGHMFLFMWPHLEHLEITEITEILRSCSHVWEVTLELPEGGKQDILGLSSPYLSFCHNNLAAWAAIDNWEIVHGVDGSFPSRQISLNTSGSCQI